MNLTTHTVTEVLSEPVEKYNWWHVDVMADSYGRVAKTTVHVKTKQEADKVKVGYEFEA